jgi:hypothetical protein
MRPDILPPRRHARITAAALAACLLLAARGAGAAEPGAPPGAGPDAGPSLEYAVKATFLAKFAPFVTWPPSVFADATSAVLICVVGEDAVTRLSDSAAARQRDGMRPIAVRHLMAAEPRSGCQIMYIAGSETQSIEDAVAAVKGTPVLTVTDSEHGAVAGAIISFTIEDNRVRFDIDDRAAAESGLGISSKLLGLAHSVRPRS